MTQRDTDSRAAALPNPEMAPDIEAVPLRIRSEGDPVLGQFLTRVPAVPGESRRDALARLSTWSRRTETAVAVLGDRTGPLYADFRALGFDDAGPLPRYIGSVRPGPVRRALAAVLLPQPRTSAGVATVPEALPDEAERALWERLAPEFGALACLPADLPERGVHLVRSGEPVASCRFRFPVSGGAGVALEVAHWIAPAAEPDVAALLALETLKAAGRGGAAAAVFETTHQALAKGLLLARFLPRRSRARVAVRQSGDREASAPSTADWHLTTPTATGQCAGARQAV